MSSRVASSAAASSGGGRQRTNNHNLRRGGLYGYGSIRLATLLLGKTLFAPLVSAAPLSSLFSGSSSSSNIILHTFADEDGPKDADNPDLWMFLGVGVALVLLGGIFAGLTIAYMGQDETYLQVISESGEGKERGHAERVLRLLNSGKHWVLVTILLSNTLTNESLPIVLDRSIGGGWGAVVSSTALIVIFGEIVPQSVCARHGLKIGAYMAPFVTVLMWILAPIAWPTAKLLDWLLGSDHGISYKKAGLKTLVQLHKSLGDTPAERLMDDEVTIINSVLDLKEKPVGDIMTPMQDVFTMSADTVLDERMMDTILSQGYSRIPIYAPDDNRNFMGMLLVKVLITYDPEDAQRVRDFSLATLPETGPKTSCLDIINFFQEGKSHMVLVSDFPGQNRGALGVVTLEDVIEELIGEEIIDESDVFIDVHKAIRRLAPAPQQRFRHHSFEPGMLDRESKDAGEDEPLLAREPGSRKHSFTNGNVQPTTFLMRRKSSTASDAPPTGPAFPVRSNPAEMREHLKHLGPSNVASKPRPTKFSSVKIKPGLGTIPQGQQTTKGTNGTDRPELLRSQSEDVGSSTPDNNAASKDDSRSLRSAGGKDASDGAQALMAGYGTMNYSTGSGSGRKRGLSEDMSAYEASKVAEQKAQESPSPSPNMRPTRADSQQQAAQQNGDSSNNNSLRVPQKVVFGSTGEEDDEVGEMEAPSRERSRRRPRARSGSITETTVETEGGMTKTVLEMTSSSNSDEEDEDEDGEDGSDDEEQSSSRGGGGGFFGSRSGSMRRKKSSGNG